MKIILLIAAVVFSLTAGHGQSNCSQHNLIGKWIKVKNIPTKSNNIDSLKQLALSANDTLAILHLNSDSTYTYDIFNLIHTKSQRDTFEIDKKRTRFTFNASKCEILLGTNKSAYKNSNLEIIYLDDKFLIYREDNNPKAYFTHLHIKK